MSSRDHPGAPEAICDHTVSGMEDPSSRSDQFGLGPDLSHLKSSTSDHRSEDECVFGSVAWIQDTSELIILRKLGQGQKAYICLRNFAESDVAAIFNNRLA